jgi:hypothetical protein
MTPTTIIDALNTRDLLGYLDAICRLRNVTREEICGRGRTKAIAAARHELWWHLRHHPSFRFSYEELGRLFDRNHSTVLQGVRAHQRSIRGAFPPPLQPEKAVSNGPLMPLVRTSMASISAPRAPTSPIETMTGTS